MNKINVDDVLFNVIAEGKKVTIIKPNGLVPEKYYGVIKSYELKKWAQYYNCLFITFRAFRKRTDYQIIITPNDTCFIINDKIDNCWRKEKISENMTNLHRLTINDFNETNIIMNHEYGQEFTDLWQEDIENIEII